MRTNVYAGLPDEFTPPAKAAQMLVDLPTLELRELYLGRIPRGWHGMIVDLATVGMAARIVETPGKQARIRALAEVPEDWRDAVRQHVLRLWTIREKYGTDATSGKAA